MKYYDCDINEYKQIIVLNDKCHAHVHYMGLGMRGGNIYSGDGVKTGTKLVETSGNGVRMGTG